jgi:hypothetical protein
MGDTHATTKVRPGPSAVSALVLDGKSCGLLRRVEGGATAADVVIGHAQPGQFVKKHIAAVRFEPFALEIGFAMEAPIYDWIAAAWKMDHRLHDGSILSCNEKLEVLVERKFTNALLTETTIPALDVVAKDPAGIRLQLAPERVVTTKGSGKASGPTGKNPEKVFLPSNFKLEIDGLDCDKVSAIGSFTVKQAIASDQVGHGPENPVPATLSFPSLKVTFSVETMGHWQSWFEEFVINGKNGSDMEKSGKLTLLSTNQQPLANIALKGLGIFSMKLEHLSDDDPDRLRMATAELYCESMEFKLGA